MIGLERGFVSLPCADKPRVLRGVVDQHGRFDLCDFVGRRRRAVEGHGDREIVAKPDRERIGNPAAEAEPDDADLARAVGTGLQPARRRDEVLGHLGAVDLLKRLPTLLVIARIAADAGQSVRREGNEVFGSEAARDILDVRIQAAILVDHQDSRQLSVRLRRPDQVPADAAIALRRRDGRVFRLDAGVVLRDLLGPGVVRAQAFPDGRSGHAADGEFLRALQEAPAVEFPVDVLVKQIQQFLRIIGGFLALHPLAPRAWIIVC